MLFELTLEVGKMITRALNEQRDRFVAEIKELHGFYLGYIDNYERGGIISALENFIEKWGCKDD